MQFEPTPDQSAFIQKAIANGRYSNAKEALQDAMSRWEEDERRRVDLLAAFDDAEADVLAGEYTDYTDGTLHRLADELKHEARNVLHVASGSR